MTGFFTNLTYVRFLCGQDTLRHEGCELLRGVKYAIRTDIMFEEVSLDASARSKARPPP